MVNGALANHLTKVKHILRRHKVQRAYAFGSVCTDKFTDASDIDLIVKFKAGLTPLQYTEHYFSAAKELEKLLHRSVDLVAEETMRNPYFIKVVNKTKTAIL